MDCVEVDPLVARLAKDQFGLQENARLSVIVSEGAEFVKQQANKKYDVVIVDVDNKDSSIRMARPSHPFIQTDFIRSVKTNCLTEKGKQFLPTIVLKLLHNYHNSFLSIIAFFA